MDIKSTSYWTRIVNEIKDENSFWNWSDFNFDSFISLLSFEYVCKNSLESEIEKILIDRYEITTDNIKLFANSIKILCFEKMEKRGSVTQADIDRCIQLVKIDISKGPQNPAHSWIRKIDFKENSYNDTHSYFEGKKATPTVRLLRYAGRRNKADKIKAFLQSINNKAYT